MNTLEQNIERPAVEFRATENGCVDLFATLDCLPGGLRLRVHEELGRDEHWITVERKGLRVTFVGSLFHLDCLRLSLGEYVARVRQERGYPVAVAFGAHGVTRPTEEVG